MPNLNKKDNTKSNKNKDKDKDIPVDNENELATLYLPLIDTHILHLKLKYHNKNIDYDDLFSFLQLGLLRAIRNYEDGHSCSIKTYIISYLRGYTKNYFRDLGLYISNTEQIDQDNIGQKEKMVYIDNINDYEEK
jgi:DNA-directed RNA polymerase specialized sigma subunit